MDSQPLVELIPDYLKGNLPPEQVQQIEAAMSADQAFASEVEAQREMMIAMRAFGSGGIQDQVSTLKETRVAPPPPMLGWRKVMVAVAAIGALILLAAAIGRLLQTNATERLLQSVPTDRISAELMLDKEASQGAGSWNPVADTLIAGMQAYNNKDFEEARKLLGAYMEAVPTDGPAAFYLGVCFLQLDNPEEAALWFNKAYHDPLIGSEARQFLDALQVSP